MGVMSLAVVAPSDREGFSMEVKNAKGENILSSTLQDDQVTMQLYEAVLSFNPSDLTDAPASAEDQVAIQAYIDALTRFCASNEGQLTYQLADAMAEQGLTGNEHRPSMFVHLLVQLCFDHNNGDAMTANSVPRTKQAFDMLSLKTAPKAQGFLGDDISPTCPAWLRSGVRTTKCNSRGRLMTGGQCADGCNGMCGPSCTCWHAVCSDCCWHPGCALHDSYCRPSMLTFKCVSFAGCAFGAPGGSCC